MVDPDKRSWTYSRPAGWVTVERTRTKRPSAETSCTVLRMDVLGGAPINAAGAPLTATQTPVEPGAVPLA